MSFKLLLSQLGLHVLLPLTSYDLYSQILSVYERSINVFLFFFFFFGCFYFRKRKSADIYEKYPFLVFSGRPMETSRRNTASHHRDNVHVYDK